MSNKNRWIQFTYEDPLEAAILQIASSKKESIKYDKHFPGCPWYKYDLIKDEDEKKIAINEQGPFYFNKQ